MHSITNVTVNTTQLHRAVTLTVPDGTASEVACTPGLYAIHMCSPWFKEAKHTLHALFLPLAQQTQVLSVKLTRVVLPPDRETPGHHTVGVV